MTPCTVLQAYYAGVQSPFQPDGMRGNPFCPVHEKNLSDAWAEGRRDTNLDHAAILLRVRPQVLPQFSLQQIAEMVEHRQARNVRSFP